ncbi:DUF6241 domain-containing protein [Peribacillus asahii]|nr:DUF6241 domain-containing protein [Peribacillus asahii]
MAKINIIGELTMKQKFKKFTIIATGLIIVGGLVSYKILENAHDYESAKSAEMSGSKYEQLKEEKKKAEEQTARIGGATSKTGLTDDSGEYEVISVMHKMTHQKVASEDKWGAVQMTSSNIDEVMAIVEANDFKNEDSLLNILKKWKREDFDAVVQDHNYFWELQNGTIGKAYGKLSEEEEAKFIENNFK